MFMEFLLFSILDIMIVFTEIVVGKDKDLQNLF